MLDFQIFLWDTKMNSTEYKEYHESLMNNNNGTSLLRTFLCILFTVQCTICSSFSRWSSPWTQYISEYLTLIVTLCLSLTLMQDYIYFLNAAGLLLAFVVYRNYSRNYDLSKHFLRSNKFDTNIVLSISCMRGLTYLITNFCILAVDFHDFPRYLAKTERFGYSLMDTGVGLFIAMGGLVHKEIRREHFKTIIEKNAKLISVLLIMGVLRYVSVKLLGYQEHVTEYGVHWNFFFTIAVCKFLSTAVLCYYDNTLICSIIMLLLYETLLYNGLQDWVFSSAPRDTLLAANREGLVSCLGFTAMYFFAVYLKRLLTNHSVSRAHVLSELVTWILTLWPLSYILDLFLPTSRTLANAAYCTYVMAITCTVLAVFYSCEVIFRDANKIYSFKVPLLLSSINETGLIYFLVANVLTGVINMATQTFSFAPFGTFLILNMYMIANLALTELIAMVLSRLFTK